MKVRGSEGAVEVGELDCGGVLGLGVSVGGEDVVLDGGNATHAPMGFGDGVGELVFDGVGGLEAGDDGGAEAVVSFLFFGGHDVEMAGEAVLEGVQGGDGAALLGARAGGKLRVAAVRFQLFVGDHFGVCSCRYTGSTAGREIGGAGRGLRRGVWRKGLGCSGMAGMEIYLRER